VLGPIDRGHSDPLGEALEREFALVGDRKPAAGGAQRIATGDYFPGPRCAGNAGRGVDAPARVVAAAVVRLGEVDADTNAWRESVVAAVIAQGALNCARAIERARSPR
jgi:hypothetical protein